MAKTILTCGFYLLFFLTPLIWTPLNYELFEYNKMMFVYALTVIIVGSWGYQMLSSKTLIFKRTPLDIPLLLFLLANILSTIFSIDRHISIWGYYSRSNGGLLSLISYVFLYYALVSNFEKKDVFKFLKAALWGAVAVSIWAIPEHFGISPSCVILTGNLNASCWIQDVQARVFATLGQPNWLAAYLAMLIPISLYFALTSENKFLTIRYALITILYYAAFTFTYSRGATLGLLGGLGVFFLGKLNISHTGGGILGIFLVINLLFGSALVDLKLLSKLAPSTRPLLISTTTPANSGTQLENGGTESGQIRFIVWKGALEIFKHYPLFGSGVETFAYSYYNFRPVEHNQVSEWDFLYNKAHNEYLNYLATTGLVGFITYLTIIGTFVVFCIKYFVSSIKEKSGKKIHNTYYLILIPALLAGYTAYLVQNFFSFSVVIISLFFYLFPALAFIITNSAKPTQLPTLFPRHQIYVQIGKIGITTLSLFLLFTLSKFWLADLFFAEGSKANERVSPKKAYTSLLAATKLNPEEPFYQSELGYAAATAAISLVDSDATSSAQFKDRAALETSRVLTQHPANISFYRTAIRTYYLLSTIDERFLDQALNTLDKTISLSPTDPKLPYNKGVILAASGKTEEATFILKKSLELKPDYKDAHLALGDIYFKNKDSAKAVAEAQAVLKYFPLDTDAREKLDEWAKLSK